MSEKILVVRLSAIGDVVRTIPAVQALRMHFPDSEIHWLVEDRCAEMITGLDCIDGLEVVPRKQWKKLPLFKQIRAFREFISQLKVKQYTMYIDFHGIIKSGLYGYFAGIKRRIGYPRGISKEGNSFFMNEIIDVTPQKMSRYRRNFLMAEYFNSSLEEQHVPLPLDESDRAMAESFFKEHGLESEKVAFMYPGTSKVGRYKRWMPERYGILADLLKDRLGLETVIGWGPGEEALVEEAVNASKNSLHILPLTTMKELSAVIEKSDVFIGGDTGPMHIASFVKTPVVVILGPSDPVHNEPAQFTPFKVVYAGVDCSPCRKKDCQTLECLKAVTPDQVLNAVESLLQK